MHLTKWKTIRKRVGGENSIFCKDKNYQGFLRPAFWEHQYDLSLVFLACPLHPSGDLQANTTSFNHAWKNYKYDEWQYQLSNGSSSYRHLISQLDRQALCYDEAINADPSKRVSKIFAATDEQTRTNTHTHTDTHTQTHTHTDTHTQTHTHTHTQRNTQKHTHALMLCALPDNTVNSKRPPKKLVTGLNLKWHIIIIALSSVAESQRQTGYIRQVAVEDCEVTVGTIILSVTLNACKFPPQLIRYDMVGL
jgi:hypothetical protein